MQFKFTFNIALGYFNSVPLKEFTGIETYLLFKPLAQNPTMG